MSLSPSHERLSSSTRHHLRFNHTSAPSVGLMFYYLALMVGITRMNVGAHYPRHVLAGAILDSVWGVLTTMVEGYAGFGIG